MESLIALGTGLAMVTECYNTCFTLCHNDEHFLVDAGGGNGILRQFKGAGIQPEKIRNMFVTHAHIDHMLGAFWVLRNVGIMMQEEKYEGEFHVWSHKNLSEMILNIANTTLKGSMTKYFHDRIIFNHIEDGLQTQICGWPITFFDIHSDTTEQYAFTLLLDNGSKLCFLGDEPCQPACLPYVENSTWLLTEAFCTYEHRDYFKPYDKNHVTLKEACELAEKMGIPNLIVWHSEDENYNRRKELFSQESRLYYNGNLYVPHDLERIDLRT